MGQPVIASGGSTNFVTVPPAPSSAAGTLGRIARLNDPLSVGSLFGIGLTTGKANPRVATAIVFSWLVTLPCAALLPAFIYWSVIAFRS